jgi:Peptidase family M28
VDGAARLARRIGVELRRSPFEVETFTLDKQIGSEPRSQGRNLVVSLGAGHEHIVIGAHYDAVRLSDGSLSHGAVDNAASSACGYLVFGTRLFTNCSWLRHLCRSKRQTCTVTAGGRD